MEAPPNPPIDKESYWWDGVLLRLYTEWGYLPVPDGVEPKVWFDAVSRARRKIEEQILGRTSDAE